MAPKSILKKRPTPSSIPTSSTINPKGSITLSKPARPLKEASSEEDDEMDADEEEEEEESDEDERDSFDDSDSGEEESDDDEDDEETIRALAEGLPRPAKKLKHTTLRPTAAPTFSLALSHLLSLPPSTSSLAPKNAPPSAHTQRLERRAKNLIRETKAQHYSRGHVRDVIVGWGARPPLPFSLWESKSAREFERAQRGEGALKDGEEEVETGAEREKRLRKLAQRGVVRLFNAIGAAQGAPERSEREEAKKRKREVDDEGSQATTTVGELGVNKITRRPNVLGGRGKGEALSNLSKSSFLDLIRQGTSGPSPLVKA